MGIITQLKEAFRKVPQTEEREKIRGKLPFVHLFGYEKSYGKPYPQEYGRMVEAYKSWVYACAWKNAVSVAKCPLKLYKQSTIDNDEQLDIISDHPFLDIIKRVNPFSNRFELFTITQIFLELTGNAYWYMPKSVLGIPYMIWNIPSHWVKIIPSKEKFVDGYVVRVPGQGQYIPFEEEEIVHFRFPSPFDLFYGVSPTYAAMYGVDLNAQAKEWAINFFMNNAQPSGVLTTDEGLSPEQYNRLRDNWNMKYRGNKNAGKIAILESGLKYQQIGSDVKTAKFEDIDRSIRDEILAMFGVPASKLGLVEDVNRANADANDYTYQKETILPRLTLIEEKLNEKVIPMYDVGILCKFDNPIPKDLTFELEERKANIASGFSSIDEERIKQGLEPYNLPETSVPLVPFNLVPAGQPKPQMDSFGMPIEEEKDDEKKDDKKKGIKRNGERKWEVFVNAADPQERLLTGTLQRYIQRQHSEVMQRLNQYRMTKIVTKDLYSNIIFNMNEANAYLSDLTKNHIRQAFITGLTLGMNDTGHMINFDLYEPNISKAVERRMGFFVETYNGNTAKLLETELIHALEGGETISEISKRVDKVFNYSSDFRAKTTARTEVIGAINNGQLKSWEEAGVTKKVWITAGDERVRESHQIHYQERELFEPFITGDGNKLMCPGDRNYFSPPPEEVINCRCTMSPIFE